MANEEEREVVEDEIPELPTTPEGEDDPTDYKELSGKMFSSAKRYQGVSKKRLERIKELEAELAKRPAVKEGAKKDFDYESLTITNYLNSKGISEEDHEYVLAEATATGKPIQEVVGFKYLKDELALRAEGRKAKENIPTGRAGGGRVDEVDYWLAKNKATGELPQDPMLRRKVVQEKIKRAKSATAFRP